MIRVNEDMLIDDLCFTAAALSGSANSDFIKNNYGNFIILNESLLYNFGKVILFDREINTAYLERILEKKEFQALKKFVDFLNDNQNIILDVSKNYGDFMKKIDFHTYPFWDNLRGYNEKDFKDLILDYFSTFGNNIYSSVKKYFDEERIHLGAIHDEYNVAGFFVGLHWLDSGYIFSIYDSLDSATASSIVHELGHAIDSERFIFPQKKNLPVFSDFYVEIPSTTFELGFNDFLVNNHIDMVGGRILDNCRVDNMMKYFDTLEQSMDNPDQMTFLPDGYAEDNDGNQYDIRDSILYGLGYYYALHLNLIRSASNKEFLKVFNNLITSRKELSFEDTIETMGFSVDDFVSGKYIQPYLENNMLELKKRYKY